nr:MAG TPA: hypothetical protein [Caudoviricetes sp.]
MNFLPKCNTYRGYIYTFKVTFLLDFRPICSIHM